MKIEDINEIYPLTIIAKDHFREDANDNYIAINEFPDKVPSPNKWIKLEDNTYISELDWWLRTTHSLFGKGNTIKLACKKLVEVYNNDQIDKDIYNSRYNNF